MDILKDFKHFLQGEGLREMIHDFRNPTWEEQFYLEAEYLPERDCRQISDEDQLWKDPIGLVFIPFKSRLQKRCEILKNELQERCVSLLVLKESNKEYINKVLSESEVDFNLIRKQVEDDSEMNRYWEYLQSFILEVETIYVKCKLKILPSGFLESPGIKTGKDKKRDFISFEFIGDLKILKKIYQNLNLEAGEFIDKQQTKEADFINILTAENVLSTPGTIRFGCESRQIAYILKKMSGSFSNLKYILIEKSRKFESKNGTLLKADSLSKYLSDVKDVKEKEAIDRFFSSLHQN